MISSVFAEHRDTASLHPGDGASVESEKEILEVNRMYEATLMILVDFEIIFVN
jgi:hypothetical protein